ncbi:zinc finger CCCH domain-containing protein 17 isoform X2 [Rhodamnia argentea]|uniref:Zinc finger CCCH domain-containing protein 17 isoform X2 n=1 Tax=Rhodamnia argentea TaxID=178133 RepID=A0A8B8QIF8_9MYRT|nr:zinc finger CCCH domain-containing protein 17 isoform X2 [Rhodamnia argentea]
MVAGTRESTNQPSHVTAPSAEEEALKRNTDCVYFLASPLTCKKGSECEYRHSEYARVNPRDCWFWLNGNCLNPKCAFRHPPLDGLLGAPATVPGGSSLPSQPPAMPPVAQASYNSGKQAVPCVFFQKGICLKGDRCAFLHGTNTVVSKVQQAPASMPVNDTSTIKKPFGSLEKCSQGQKVTPNASKLTSRPSDSKPFSKVENALPRNEASIAKGAPPSLPPPRSIDEGASRYRPSGTPTVNGNPQNRTSRLHQPVVPDDYPSLHKEKEVDEYLRESSPGFDVLVDDELGESDYYHNDDQFGRGRTHEGRNIGSVTDYDLDRPGDYSADIEHEMFRDPRAYDSFDRRYGWDQRQDSSELILGGPILRERRAYPKSESPDHADDSDLRHRLSKQRRVNGLRSVVSHDFVPDSHVADRTYRGSSRRDSQHSSSHESQGSSRLKGRIKFPGRLNGGDVHSDREMEMGRNLGRSYLGVNRLRDRLTGRAQEDVNVEARNFQGPRMRRESGDENSISFAGPKSLAELKGMGRGQESSSSIGKQQNFLLDQPLGDVSFEGPKPLSVLLKRKREPEGAGSGSRSSASKEEHGHEVNSQKHGDLTVHPKEEEDGYKSSHNLQVSKSGTADAVGNKDHTEGACNAVHGREIENEDGMIAEDATEDPEVGAEDQRDGDYTYEQGDGGDYNYEEGENADGEGEGEEEDYLDDEDGDDFEKKVGVMFS